MYKASIITEAFSIVLVFHDLKSKSVLKSEMRLQDIPI